MEPLTTFSANFSFFPQLGLKICDGYHTTYHTKRALTTVCHAYEDFYGEKAPIPTKYLREILYFILTENSFQYCGSNYLQIHGTVMGAKIAVAF